MNTNYNRIYFGTQLYGGSACSGRRSGLILQKIQSHLCYMANERPFISSTINLVCVLLGNLSDWSVGFKVIWMKGRLILLADSRLI